MRIAFFLTLFLVCCGVVYAANDYKWALVRIERIGELEELSSLGIILDHYNKKAGEAYIYVTDRDIDLLKSIGYKVELISPDSFLGRRLYPGSIDGYHTYSDLISAMRGYASTYSAICKLDSIGPTVGGRWIWILKISDNVNLTEPEPQFRFMSTMHGDEPVGMELCLYLADYILTNYLTDTLLNRLVSNLEIYIVPLVNPDGYVARQRVNSNGVDLNRNFPVPDGSIGDDGTYALELETQAIINFTEGRNFVLSANFHTGATVVNYPWDYTPSRAPDDSLLKLIAITYSSRNPAMWNSTTFPHGITNGYDWYQVRGSMQDYLYNRGELDFTIELYDTKWPDASALPAIWNNNRESMIAFMNWASKGVYGFVTDSITGEPIYSSITMNISGKPAYTDPLTGFYQRIIYPGNYSFTYSALGYYSRTLYVSVPAGGFARVDVKLYPIGTCVVTGNVDLIGSESDSGAIVVCRNDSVSFVDTTGFDGYFEFRSVYAIGNWTISAFAPGYADSTIVVNLTGRSSYELGFSLYPYMYFYSSDFESDNGGLIVVGSVSDWEWGVPTTGPGSAHSGTKLWATKLVSNYSNNSNSILELPPLYLPSWSRAKLRFWHWYSFEYSSITGRYYDGGNVKISVDGGNYTLIEPVGGYNCTIYSSNPYIGGERAFGGSSGGWREAVFDLSPYAGYSVTIRFHFGSDANVRYSGWYIDDVSVVSPNYMVSVSDDNKTFGSPYADISIYPNPFNGLLRLRFSDCRGNEPVKIEIFDLIGRCLASQMISCTRECEVDFSSFCGGELASGIYFLRVNWGGVHRTAKLIYLR